MLIELHSHTIHSHGKKIYYDGVDSPENILKTAKTKGLDAIAITDHDTMKGFSEAKKLQKKHRILVIPGEEISTKDGHLLALGIQEAVKPWLSVEETLDKIHEQGGIGVASHPFDIKRDGMGRKAMKCDAIEVFNSQNIDRLSNYKAKKLAEKTSLPQTAGSDAHLSQSIGLATIKTKANGVDGLLKAIKKNQLELNTKYNTMDALMRLAIKRLTMSYDKTIDYMNKNYSWPKRIAGKILIPLVRKSPGRIDYFFKPLTYLAFAGVILYSLAVNISK